MKRENNIDCLKVLGAIFVILIHLSYFWTVASNDNFLNFTVANFYNSLSAGAVPIFVMISGRYLLEKKEIEYKIFYKKIYKKIYRKFIIWCLFYNYYSIYILENSEKSLIYFLKKILSGNSFYHLWYLYMMIGIYLLLPVLIKLKNKIGKHNFFIFGIILLILGMIFFIVELILSKYILIPDLIKKILFSHYMSSIKFVGYFILGNSLKNIKRDYMWVWYLISVVIIFSLVEITKSTIFYQTNLPLVMFSVLSLYLFFNNLNIKYEFFNFAKNGLDIYVIHAVLLIYIWKITIKILNGYPNPIWYIPLVTFITFFLSNGLATILNRIKNIL